MTVKDLIAKLQKMPQDLEVGKINHDGCSECNAECLPMIRDVSRVEYYPPYEGPYPYHDKKKAMVVL